MGAPDNATLSSRRGAAGRGPALRELGEVGRTRTPMRAGVEGFDDYVEIYRLWKDWSKQMSTNIPFFRFR